MKGSESLCVVLHISPHRTVLDQSVVWVQEAPCVFFQFHFKSLSSDLRLVNKT